MTLYDSEQLDRLEPGYLARYGLSQAPFSPAYDENLVYLDAERTQRLNMLQHLTQFSDLLLIVRGERGIGKTTLMRRFITSAEEDWRICQVDASPMMHADQLLRHVATGFGLHPLPDEPVQLQQTLFDHLLAFQHRAVVPILVIDDAHDLPEDALETLFNLADSQGADGHLLRIILFCEPQIETALQAPAIHPLRERVTHTLEIPPLTEEQVAEYLRHRMTACGARGEYPFTPKHIRRIHHGADGVPGRINQLAHQVLRDGRVESTESPIAHDTTAKRLDPRYMLLALAVILVVSLAITYQDEINALFEEAPGTPPLVTDATPSDTAAATPPTAPAPPVTVDPAARPSTDGAQAVPPAPLPQQTMEFQVDQERQLTQAPEPEVPTQVAAEPVTTPATTVAATPATPPAVTPSTPSTTSQEPSSPVAETPHIETATPAAVSPPLVSSLPPSAPAQPARPPLRIDSLTPSRVVGSSKIQSFKLRGEGFHDDVQITVAWGDKKKQLSTDRISIINNNALTFRITTGTQAQTWRVTVSDPRSNNEASYRFQVEAPTVAPDPAKVTVAEARRDDWWRKQNPQYFTIQLLTASQEKTASQFVASRRVDADLGYVTVTKNGNTRYTVLGGVYPTSRQAQAALQALPAEVKQLKPWVRRLDSVISQMVARTAASSPIPAPPAATASTTIPVDPEAQTGWLWSQNPKSFTLQILGAQQEDRIRQFVRENKLEGKVVWFKTQQNNRDWFALLYGVYPNRDAALQARNQLPAPLRKASPWIRSFGSIHAELAPR